MINFIIVLLLVTPSGEIGSAALDRELTFLDEQSCELVAQQLSRTTPEGLRVVAKCIGGFGVES